ncbi:hypothetical protein GYMLUDRAFT_39179 [Collybiopsis luxurians FD-317 M1]|nr:hypothetical protein GYMLUDRAFT_39179 [Collybiopsis luxurians FD-317 M1]
MTTANPVPVPRPLRGSRIDIFYPVRPENIPSLSSLESAFQLQEYISLVIRLDVHDVDRIVSIPGKNGNGNGKSAGEDTDSSKIPNVDEACWIYEQLRRLAQDLTHPLITNLQTECTRQTCPEMKAGEWLYLCVAHGNDGGMEQCCAIDYILHTIDSATALLNSPRAFPSRLSIPAQSHRHFSSLARRLGRIFAHAYFHHRALFEQAEAESSLYRRFEEIVARWNLVPREFLVIPTRDDNGEIGREEPKLNAAAVVPTILSNDQNPSNDSDAEPSSASDALNVSPPHLEDDSKSPGSGSPGRRFGRNRTDTMVFSDATSIIEELSKSPAVQPAPEPESEPEPVPEVQSQQAETATVGTGGEEEDGLLLSSSDNPDTDESEGPQESDETTPAIAIDEVDKAAEAEAAPPPTLEEESELPVVTPSSSTAPSDSVPLDVRIVEDSPKKEENFADAQGQAEAEPASESVSNEESANEDASSAVAQVEEAQPEPKSDELETESTEESETAEELAPSESATATAADVTVETAKEEEEEGVLVSVPEDLGVEESSSIVADTTSVEEEKTEEASETKEAEAEEAQS